MRLISCNGCGFHIASPDPRPTAPAVSAFRFPATPHPVNTLRMIPILHIFHYVRACYDLQNHSAFEYDYSTAGLNIKRLFNDYLTIEYPAKAPRTFKKESRHFHRKRV